MFGNFALLPRPRITSTRRYIAARIFHYSSSKALRYEEQSNFLGSFFERNSPPERAVDYFSSVEWTRKVIENEDYEVVPFFPRYFNEYTGENRFFGQTVNTDSTIPHVLSLRLKDIKTPHSSPSSHDLNARHELRTQPDAICLMSLGRSLEEHPTIAHGGFQAVLFDEIMRFVVLLHHHQTCQPGPRNKHYTTNMSLSYHAPVFAPSDILLRSRLIRREGRKWFTEAEIVDGAGTVLTTAEKANLMLVFPLSGDPSLTKLRYEYVKAFEQPDVLLPNTWIVVRIDGRGFHKLTDRYAFKKPNDRRALDLMNAAAVEVMKDLPDLCIAYGVSDEYRKLVTTIVSTFTAHYVYQWGTYFPDTPLQPPHLPSFDGRAVIYPNTRIFRDYMSWRQITHTRKAISTISTTPPSGPWSNKEV
ncbi:tRNAHis guanylyltransferase-domain-containing protein [Aspergillus floccosus]